MKTEISLTDSVLSTEDMSRLKPYGEFRIGRSLYGDYKSITFESTFEVKTLDDLIKMHKDLDEPLIVTEYEGTLKIEIYNGYRE